MPNKRASRNAYFFFALDMIPELRRRGLQVSGVKEAIPLCSEDWALLPAEAKDRYAEKAKEWKSRETEPPRGSLVMGFVHEKEQKFCTELREVGREPTWFHTTHEDLEKRVIYIINIFSHGEMPSLCDQPYVPCEIGCVRYSLQNGVMDSFHDFIDPGELPLGFRYHCQAGSDATHQIPVSGFELANRDYHNLFHSLCNFISPPPKRGTAVYCKNVDLYRVGWCLQWLSVKAGIENLFQLQDIESLIIKFYREKLNEEPSKSSVNRLLDVVQWDYASNTRCKWHEDNDMWYCALASCKKITYCISRALASVYDVTLTAAHLPNLHPYDNQKSDNSKTVILNAKRYQKKNFNRPYLAENGSAAGAAGGECSLGMRGVNYNLSSTSRAQGRGILRLLAEMPAPSPSSG
ncbi:protein maelstrom homolog isoform X3 [Hyla sarda]|uniref:protein maelstrom homolog isoform X3 n=1 Tax=Hyla sarda TaxID=327740 RepID=UPI0024C25F8E|nr:protein maelstrom homolog isoform X3 [Hyla sarda]